MLWDVCRVMPAKGMDPVASPLEICGPWGIPSAVGRAPAPQQRPALSCWLPDAESSCMWIWKVLLAGA